VTERNSVEWKAFELVDKMDVKWDDIADVQSVEKNSVEQ
jgi:hypothetical protein